MAQLRFDIPLVFKGAVDLDDSQWLFNQAKSQAGQDLFVIAMTQGRRHGTWLEIGCAWPVRSNNTYLLEKKLGWTGVSIDLECMDTDIISPYEEYWFRFYYKIKRANWPADPVAVDLVPDKDWVLSMPYYQNFIARQISDIDRVPSSERNWSSCRPRTKFYQTDALTFDYNKISKSFDYLQIDIHPSLNNLAVLEILLPTHRFAVITFEHDVWDQSPESALVRLKSRQLLRKHGYQLIISDASVPQGQGHGIGDAPIDFEDWWINPALIPETVWSLYQNLESSDHGKYYHDLLFRAQQ